MSFSLRLHSLLHRDHVIGSVIIGPMLDHDVAACLTCLYARPTRR